MVGRRRAWGWVLAASVLLGGLPAAGRAQDAGALPGVEGDRYVSPTYGYALAWDDGWRAEASSTGGRVDELRLGNGTSTVTLLGRPFAGDPTACVEEAAAALGADPAVAGFGPALDGEGQPLAGSDDLGAYASYNYTAGGEERSAYLDCRPLVPGEAVLLITHEVARAAYNAELAARATLLDDLVLQEGDDSTVSPPSGGQSPDGEAAVEGEGREPVRWSSSVGDLAVATWVFAADGFLCVFNSALTMLDAATGQELWKETADSGRAFSPPTIVDGTVYVDVLDNERGVIQALDAETGEERWRFELAHLAEYQLPVVDGTVYAADVDGDLFALDAATGRERWRVRLDWGATAAPVISDGTVYATDTTGILYALDAATGTERWRSTPDVWPGVGITGLTIAQGSVYVVELGLLRALDETAGQERWRFGNAAGPATAGPNLTSPVVHPDGTLLFGQTEQAGDGTSVSSLIALEAASGEERWRRPAGRSPIYPQVTDDALYTVVDEVSPEGTAVPSLVALDVATGEERWKVQGVASSSSAPSFAVLDGVLYALERDHLVAIDAGSGAEAWRVRTGETLTGSPVWIEGVVVVGGKEGNVYAVDPAAFEAAPSAVSQAGERTGTVGQPLITTSRLDPLPAGEGFVGLWRLVLAPEAEVRLPAFDGSVVALVQSGSLAVVGGVDIVSNLDGSKVWLRQEVVETGDAFLIPAETTPSVRTTNPQPVDLLLTGTVAGQPSSHAPDADGLTLDLLGWGAPSAVPTRGAVVKVWRESLAPDGNLPAEYTLQPELIVVESGAVELTAMGGTELGDTALGSVPAGNTLTVRAGDAALLEAGSFSQMANGNEGPLVLYRVEVWEGEGPVRMGGGCGGRCLSPRRPGQ